MIYVEFTPQKIKSQKIFSSQDFKILSWLEGRKGSSYYMYTNQINYPDILGCKVWQKIFKKQ